MTRRTAALCVFAIVLVAFGLRLAGLNFSLPEDSPADERVWESQLETARGTPGPLADDYDRFYPDLVPRLCALVTPPVHPPSGCDPNEHRAAAARDLMRLRFIVLLLSLLAIPATYRIARMMLGRSASLCATGFAATSLLTQSLAQEARPHAAAGGIVGIALLLLCAARRRPSIGRWLAAGAACAIALSILQSSLALLPAILVAAVLAAPSGSRTRPRWLGPALCLIAMSVALAFQPALGVVGSDRPVAASAVRIAGHVVYLDRFDGSGFGNLLHEMWLFDPLILVLSTIGLARFACALTWKRSELSLHRDALVVLGYAVPFCVVLGCYARSYDRFMIPLLPVAATCAAAASTSWTRAPGRIALGVTTLCLAVQTLAAVKCSAFRAAPDTNHLAARWLEDHVDPHAGTIDRLTYVEVPVLRTRASLVENSAATGISKLVWDHYLRRVPDETLDRCGYDLTTIEIPREEAVRESVRRDAGAFVASIPAHVVIVQRVVRYPVIEAIHAGIAARGTLLARFSPRRDGGELLMPARGVPVIWALLSLERGGPVIEIWSL